MKAKALTSFLLFYVFLNNIYAQNANFHFGGANSLALGGAGSTLLSSEAIFSNQAGLASLTVPVISVAAVRNFSLDELQTFHFGTAIPTKAGTAGLLLHHFGFSQYQEQQIGLLYARKLAAHLSVGAQLQWLSTRIPTYGTAHIFTFEIGLQANVNPHLILGAHLYSPMGVAIVDNYRLPTALAVGLVYQVGKQIAIYTEAEKTAMQPLVAKLGVSYQVVSQVALRAGVRTQPYQHTFGVAFYLPSLRLEIGSAYHPVLGITPGLTATYSFEKDN